ncbi:hypothetical protein Tco_0697779 [Tanacetum coccineum]
MKLEAPRETPMYKVETFTEKVKKRIMKDQVNGEKLLKKLERIGNLKPVNMVIEMADRSIQSPKGIAENVLVPIILGRPILATAHARIDVFGGKISLEVGTEQILFNTNEGTSPSTISPIYQNDLLPNLDDLEDISLSQCKSPGYNGDTPREFQGSDNNMGIEIDDLIEGMDDLWDDL